MPVNTALNIKRQIDIGGKRFTSDVRKDDVRMEGSVSHGDDGLTFKWSLWNLKRSSWSAIAKDEPVRISLGYGDGLFQEVLLGTVTEKDSPSFEGADTKYTFRGSDESRNRLRNLYWSKTWQSPPVAQVVSDIAGYADLGIDVIDASGISFARRHPILKKHALAHWLNECKKHVNAKSETRHDWYARAGKLYFGPVEQSTQQALTMHDGQNGIVRAGGMEEAEGSNQKTDGPPDLDFDVLLDPRIEKDALVSVDTRAHSGVYRVDSYELKTSTDDGSHQATGTMADASSEYRVESTNQFADNPLTGGTARAVQQSR